MWWKGDSETRYKYLYSSDEIEELSDRTKSASVNAKLLFALFNNHWQGYAPRNAVDIKRFLQLPLKELPVQTSMMRDEMSEE